MAKLEQISKRASIGAKLTLFDNSLNGFETKLQDNSVSGFNCQQLQIRTNAYGRDLVDFEAVLSQIGELWGTDIDSNDRTL